MTLIKPQGLFSDTNINRIEFILMEQAFSFNSRPHPQYYNFPWTVEIRRKEVNEYFGSEYLKKISKFTKWKQIRQDPLDLDALTNSWDDGNVSYRNFC